jgi:hypothetical protein
MQRFKVQNPKIQIPKNQSPNSKIMPKFALSYSQK